MLPRPRRYQTERRYSARNTLTFHRKVVQLYVPTRKRNKLNRNDYKLLPQEPHIQGEVRLCVATRFFSSSVPSMHRDRL